MCSESAAVRRTLQHARVVLANSAGTARRCAARGAARSQVVHLGTDLPPQASPPPKKPTLVTVGNLIARKRHADVIEALALLKDAHPDLSYVIVGDGPERQALKALASTLGVRAETEFRGRLPHDQAVAVARDATLFVMPSAAEAFGVAYVEAMAAGVPAIGAADEDGPREIAGAGPGIELVPAQNPQTLSATIDGLLRDPARLDALRGQARETVAREFTWDRCGRETVMAYEQVLRG